MTAADLQAFVGLGQNFNGAIPAIVLEICRAIGECILAPQIVLNLPKGIRNIGKLKRHERTSPRSIGNPLQNLISAASAGKIGADRVNDSVGA